MSMPTEVNKRILDFLNNDVWKPDYMIPEDLADEVVDMLLGYGLTVVEKDVHEMVEAWWWADQESRKGTKKTQAFPVTTEAREQLEEYGIDIDEDIERLLSVLEKIELSESQNEKTLPQGVSLKQYSQVLVDVCFRLTGN